MKLNLKWLQYNNGNFELTLYHTPFACLTLADYDLCFGNAIQVGVENHEIIGDKLVAEEFMYSNTFAENKSAIERKVTIFLKNCFDTSVDIHIDDDAINKYQKLLEESSLDNI